VARTPAAYAALSAAFAERRIEKRYLAIAYGSPRPVRGTFRGPIGRHPTRRKQMAVTPRGRPATTHYEILRASGGLSLLALTLETGRTHQIRVHLKAAGHPLVGDPVYGEARWKQCPAATRRALEEFARPALHAWRLRFAHPRSGEPIAVEAPVPQDLRTLWVAATGQEPPVA
jgi:23S rRNA pseudouridine1911/1915/1917 synthase